MLQLQMREAGTEIQLLSEICMGQDVATLPTFRRMCLWRGLWQADLPLHHSQQELELSSKDVLGSVRPSSLVVKLTLILYSGRIISWPIAGRLELSSRTFQGDRSCKPVAVAHGQVSQELTGSLVLPGGHPGSWSHWETSPGIHTCKVPTGTYNK